MPRRIGSFVPPGLGRSRGLWRSATSSQPASVLVAVGDAAVEAKIGGVVRGLIKPGIGAEANLKIADIDPRADVAACFEISDKARLVGAGVLEAVLTWLNRK